MPRWKLSRLLTREHATRGVLAAAVAAVALVASFGVGYRASAPLLDGAGAYLQRGETVVHVNAESGTEDAEAARKLATGKQRLQVVQVGPNSVWVVNTETGEVWRLPTRTMRPEKVGGKREGGKAPNVVAGGGEAYLVDPDNKKLTELDPRRDRRREIRTPAPVDVAVVDSAGAAWALARSTGELYLVKDGKLRHTSKVAADGEEAQLTLAGDRPVVYRAGRGEAATYGGDGLLRRYHLDPEDGSALVPTSPVKAPVLVAVIAGKAEVTALDLRTGKPLYTTLIGRESSRFGPPAVLGNRVYLPDQTNRQVVQLDLRNLRVRKEVQVPGQDDFEVFVRDNRVWVNDPYAPTMLVFDRSGRHTEVDRSGKEVDGADPVPGGTPSPDDDTTPPPSQPPDPKPSQPPSSTGPPKATVPDVIGMDKTKACRVVQRARLVCEFVSRQDPDADTNEVIETDPRAGRKVGVGSTVTIVHGGPAVVPGVIGLAVEQACERIKQARFICVKEARGVANSPAEVNKVYQQHPPKDTPLTTGSPVTVYYPTPGLIKVPNVVRANPTNACQTLQAWGLGCAPNAGEVTWEANVVHSQSPPAGTAVSSGTHVSYVFQDHAPVLLDRWKLYGHHVRFLAPYGTPPPPGDWRDQAEMGGVYTSPDQVAGLVWVNRFKCTKGCSQEHPNLGYLFKRGQSPRADKWHLEGPAFACFNPDGTAPDGTHRLEALHHPGHGAWAFAVRDSREWQIHRNNGYQQKFTVCNVWFGVPDFRPNG